MKIEFNPAKSARNAKERGLRLELTAELDWTASRVRPDDRCEYGEKRCFALVSMSGRLYAVCYRVRDDARRVISFRKTNKREGRGLLRRPLADKDDEIRELMAEDMRLFKPKSTSG